jgi:hypothetical protein
MALVDPQVITVNAVAKSMPMLNRGDLKSFYQMDDKTFSLDIRHVELKKDKKARVRSTVTFTQRAVVPDPLTAVNDFEEATVSFQIDRPDAGFTAAQIDQMVVGFKSWLSSTIVTNLFGRQS